MRFDRKLLLASTVIAGFAMLSPVAALAQATPTTDQAPPSKASSVNEVEEVVVTGSRVKRSEYNSADPIQVISGDTASLEGLSSVGQILETSTLVANAAQVNNQLSGFVVTGGPGGANIQLRGLGANRTLVLVDGHRMGPAGVGGTVGPFDLNVLPASIIDHIEILKDGASSIYGSDAVAGVINVLTKKNIDGGIISAYTNVSQYGGGNQYNVNAAWGKVFDKGYVNVAFDYADQQALTAGQRPDTACAADYVFDNQGHRLDFKQNGHSQCYNLFANAFETPTYSGGTMVLTYQLPGVTYPTASQGNSDSFGRPVPAGYVREDRGGFPATFPYFDTSSPFYNNADVISPSKTYTLTARGGVNLSSDVELYGNVLFNRRESSQARAAQFFPTVFAGMDNVPAVIRADPNTGAGPLGFALLPIIPYGPSASQRVDYVDAAVGLRGKFGDMPIFGNWDWDINARASHSSGAYTNSFIYNDRVTAIDGALFTSRTTAAVCNQGQITISGGQKGGQCAALGPNGIPLLARDELAGHFTAAERAFLFGEDEGRTTYDEQEFEATMTGDLLTLPAGKMGAAFGVDIRHASIDDLPGFDGRNNNYWGQSSSGETKGSDTVKEVFGEIDAPLVRNAPFMQKLDLQASARYTDYDIAGSNTTYKVGLNWQVNDWLRLRGDRGTSFRAPALYENFLADQTSFLPQTSIDPCVNYGNSANANITKNCAALGLPPTYAGNGSSAIINTQGGLGRLKPETSEATTIGVILTPKFADLSLTVDYSDINVKNEVTRYGASNIVTQCMQAATFPHSPFCSLFVRDSNPASTTFNQILSVNDSYVNIASQTVRAIDVTARYRKQFDFGSFEFNTALTWDLENASNLFAGFPQPNYNGTTFREKGPSFDGQSYVRFTHGPWTAQWTVQMLGHGSDMDSDLVGPTANTTRYSTTCRSGSTGAIGPCTAFLGTPVGHPVANTVLPVTISEKNYVEFTTYHAFSVRRTFDSFVIEGGVQNIFNERPPAVSSSDGFRVGTAALNGYDMVGRRFFLDFSKKF